MKYTIKVSEKEYIDYLEKKVSLLASDIFDAIDQRDQVCGWFDVLLEETKVKNGIVSEWDESHHHFTPGKLERVE